MQSYQAIVQKLSQSFQQVKHATKIFYQWKKEAFEQFQNIGLPTDKNEVYKYAPIAQFFPDKAMDYATSLSKSVQKIDSSATFPLQTVLQDAYHLVINNGVLDVAASILPDKVPGVSIVSFSTAWKYNKEFIHQHFLRSLQHSADPFQLLNTSFFQEGVVIQVACNTHLDKPLIVHYTGHPIQDITYPRCLVLVGEHSSVTVMECIHHAGTTLLYTNILTEIILDAYADVTYYNLQTNSKTIAVHHTQCSQACNSNLQAYTITLEGNCVRNNLSISLEGTHSHASMYGLYIPSAKQYIDHHTTVFHQQPYTTSKEHYKGILFDQARSSFNGKIFVHRLAQKTNAFQSNNNLLLSNEAVLNTKPQLEIFADDVRCSHGATTGQLHPEQLFYMQARGLDKFMAQCILTKAFADEIVDKIAHPVLKKYIYKLCEKKINSMHYK